MNKIVKKVSIIFAIGVGIIVAMFAAFVIFLRIFGIPHIPEDAVLVTDSKYERYANVDLIREITMVQDFPPFDSEIYESTTKSQAAYKLKHRDTESQRFYSFIVDFQENSVSLCLCVHI